MLNSVEHEIFSANKYENANFLAEKNSCSAIFSKNEFAFVSNLRFISRTNFMLIWVEHEKRIITSGPGVQSRGKVYLALRGERAGVHYNVVRRSKMKTYISPWLWTIWISGSPKRTCKCQCSSEAHCCVPARISQAVSQSQTACHTATKAVACSCSLVP